MRSDHFLHGRYERAPFAAAALEDLKFAGERNRFDVQLGVQHLADEINDLVHACRILFEHLPDQGLAIQTTPCRQKGLRV